MNLKNINIAYFIGIGGIGMSALARWFNHNKIKVIGYDKTSTPLTTKLAEEGMSIHFEDSIDLLPIELKSYNKHAIIVYTPAVPNEHEQMNYLIQLGFRLYKRSEVLGIITRDQFTVAVAGTHGKTTTSSMIAHLLKQAGVNCSAFLGGITANYKTNLLLNEQGKEDNIVVVEADEYDRSFLTLHPNIAVITSADADHLDIYDNKDNLLDSFKAFIDKIETNGKLFIHESVAEVLVNGDQARITTFDYAKSTGSVFSANVKIVNGNFVFDFNGLNTEIPGLTLKVPGFHNLENAIAAIAVSIQVGLTKAQIKSGIESYAGVSRRFEYILKTPSLIFIDDYAHHPVEIAIFIESVKALYPDRKITVIFQPHLYSRTRDFAAEFASSLSMADEVYLLNIYPARERPIPGVSADLIFDQLTCKSKIRCAANELVAKIRNADIEVLATIGAGNIDQLVTPLKTVLLENKKVE